MFYIIGLGLGDYKDVTVKGLEIVQNCSRVYLESYTSILTCGTEALVRKNIFYINVIKSIRIKLSTIYLYSQSQNST